MSIDKTGNMMHKWGRSGTKVTVQHVHVCTFKRRCVHIGIFTDSALWNVN